MRISMLAEKSIRKWQDPEALLSDPCYFCYDCRKDNKRDCDKCKIDHILCYPDHKASLYSTMLKRRDEGKSKIKHIDEILVVFMIRALNELRVCEAITPETRSIIEELIE